MVDESEEPEHLASRRRRTVWGRRCLIGGVAAVLLLVLLVALLPTLLSTGPGTRLLTRIINATIDGSVEVEQARLTWLGDQSVRGVVLRDPDHEPVAVISAIDMGDIGLLRLAMGSRDFGHVRVQIDEAHIRQQPGEATNVAQAVGMSDPDEPAPPDEPTQIDDLSLQLELTARRITYESPDVETVELNNLTATAMVPSLRDLQIELRSDLQQGGETGRIDAKVALRDGFSSEGEIRIAAATIDGFAEVTNLPVGMIDRLAHQHGRLAALLGEQITATVRTRGQLQDLTAQVVARSSQLAADLQLVSDEAVLHVAENSRATLTITPASFAALTAPASGGTASDAAGEPVAEQVRLVEPFTVNLQVVSLVLPRTDDGLALESATVDASVTADDIVLDVPEQGQTALRGLSLAVTSQALSERLTAQLQATAELAGASEPVAATLSVRNLLHEDQPLAAALQAQALPIALVDAVAQQEGKLIRLLGETLGTDVHVEQNAAGDLAFAGSVRSPTLAGAFEGSYGADGLIALRTPQAIQLTLSPAVFADWMTPEGADQPAMALESPTAVEVDVETFQVLLLPDDDPDAPLRIEPDRSQLTASLMIPYASLRDTETRERVNVEEVVLNIRAPTLRQAIDLLASLRLEAIQEAGAESQPGALESRTQIRNLISAQGVFQPELAEVSSDTQLEAVPSKLIDSLLKQGGELAAVLGATTSADVQVDFRRGQGGEARFQLHTDNTQGDISALIDAEGDLTLREDARLSVHVTPEVSQVILRRINPMLAGAGSADVPMTLVVREEGFIMPLADFDWTQISAMAALDTGDLTLSPSGFTGVVLGLLEQFNVLQRQRSYLAQLSPISLAVDRGRLAYDGLSLSIGGANLGFAGNVNLATQALDLRMQLGGDGMIRELRGMTIPIGGTITSPQLDRDAVVRMAAERGLDRALEEIGGQETRGILDALRGRGTEGLFDIFRGQTPPPPRDSVPPETPTPPDSQTRPEGAEDPDADAAQEQTEPRRDPLQGLFDIGRRVLEENREQRNAEEEAPE